MIEWVADLTLAPIEKQVLLCFVRGEKMRVRVGFLRDGLWFSFSAGGLLTFPQLPVRWAAINYPEGVV